MVASSHQVMGFTWGLVAITISHSFGLVPDLLFANILFFVSVMIGSLLPDIDTPKSKLGGPFDQWGFIVILTLIAVEAVTPGVNRAIQFSLMILSPMLFVFSGHRKFTHSLSFLMLMGAYSMMLYTYIHIPVFYLIGFLAGIASHLFGDYLTKRGIPLLYPFSKKYFRFFVTFRTGSKVEQTITTILVVLNLILLARNTLS